jgi:chromosome segregation ATPase
MVEHRNKSTKTFHTSLDQLEFQQQLQQNASTANGECRSKNELPKNLVPDANIVSALFSHIQSLTAKLEEEIVKRHELENQVNALSDKLVVLETAATKEMQSMTEQFQITVKKLEDDLSQVKDQLNSEHQAHENELQAKKGNRKSTELPPNVLTTITDSSSQTRKQKLKPAVPRLARPNRSLTLSFPTPRLLVPVS